MDAAVHGKKNPSHFYIFRLTILGLVTGKTNGAKMPVSRVASNNVGLISTNSNGQNFQGINEEIIWTCIGMSITIAILITMSLCYILREKCRKRHEYYVSA